MKAFSLANAAHLPVTGESHPLVRESTRWLTTGNAISLLGALLLFGLLYAWSQTNQDENSSPPVRIAETHDIVSPPQIVPKIQHGVQPTQKKYGVVEPVPDAVASDDEVAGVKDFPGIILGEDGFDMPVNVPNNDFRSTPSDTFVFFDELPVLLSIAEPMYPDLPRQAGIEGTVLVKVLITRAGKVKNTVVIDGPEPLRDSAVSAAKTALFKPAKQGDVPVEAWVILPVVFSLNR